ncbi:phage portal protein [Methylobacterium nodulans]|uniref:phage portal protein n=1 Tax=Methylobacterium nodulans TaxID=114616 RepID=UPI0002EF9D7C
MRDASDEVQQAWWRAAGRANDIIHNSGWVAGAVDQAVANTVGTGLRLSALPDAVALGLTEGEASKLGRLIEQRFELWARNPYECDIECRRSFGQLQAAAFRGWFAPGEIVSETAWKTRPGGQYGTKVRLIPPHRLSQRSEYPRLVQGVRMDQDWAPQSYIFWRRQGLSDVEIEVRAREAGGRVRIGHVFDGVAGQYRGISPLVPALQVARQFDQLADATLTAALIRAVFAATVKSNEPTEEVLKGLLTPQEQARMHSEGLTAFDCWASMQDGWYKGTTIDLGEKGRFAHLFPGQELTFHSAQGSASDYKDQALFLLRELLRCLGLTYESGTGDYTNATYSSVRMATGEIFQITLYRRRNIVAPFCQPHYEGWLEEEIESGAIPFPGGIDGFMANRTAACRAEWRGSPKPQADDLKTAKAHETYRNMGVMTDEMIANDLGVDIEDVYRQRARERDMREEYGLPENGAGTVPDTVSDKLVTQKDD